MDEENIFVFFFKLKSFKVTLLLNSFNDLLPFNYSNAFELNSIGASKMLWWD